MTFSSDSTSASNLFYQIKASQLCQETTGHKISVRGCSGVLNKLEIDTFYIKVDLTLDDGPKTTRRPDEDDFLAMCTNKSMQQRVQFYITAEDVVTLHDVKWVMTNGL